jgi:hypothetical protein
MLKSSGSIPFIASLYSTMEGLFPTKTITFLDTIPIDFH